MGVDIHLKTYVWSKFENRYIDAYSLCDNLSIMMKEYHYGEFPEFVGDRICDLFGLFGESHRSEYPELTCLKCGIPDFLENTTFWKLIDRDGTYGFSWCLYPDLKRCLLKYIKYLKDPEKFLDKDSDFYAEWKENPESDDVKNVMGEWIENNNCLIKHINDILDKLRFYDNLLKNDDFSYESSIGKLIDVKKTIFVFWFDN